MSLTPDSYSRERDYKRAAQKLAERVGSFDLVAAGDPVEIQGDPRWSSSTKELWLVVTQSEVAQHRWTSTDWIMLKDMLAWWEEVPPHKRGAHAYAVRAQVLSELGLTDKGRRGLGLVVDKAPVDPYADLTPEMARIAAEWDAEDALEAVQDNAE
jgi:hypothetical protein